MSNLILLRGGSESEWTAADPILAAREVGVTTDTHRIKVGDGVTEWSALPYADAGAATSAPVTLADEDYAVTDGDYLIVALEGCEAVTLPTPDLGRSVAVKATVGPVVIVGDIDTEAAVTLDPWEALTLTGTGTLWVVT